ncbi:Na/Pi-cotransporter [Crenobacter luteus]|uniref:Na/Pi cotransporter family protein n=1 Tax=Crenobacter luteus TaxID=1452487 RepID=UPI00104DFF54|nr:Na/Pi symporter [Crenobacter luteus]TCP10264.1 Na/Pi-cotransporter [Crenobacter luteus]
MTTLQTLVAALAAVALFLYGLDSFSRELRAVGGEALKAWLGRVTASRWLGFAVGAAATAVVQSSSAVTSLTVVLVDAAVLSFRASLGVLLGANVGTTMTAWLVSFKLTGIGPVFIVLGMLLSALPTRAGVAGKAVFYFGLIFFALDLISAQLAPLRDEPQLRAWLGYAATPAVGVLAGVAITALIQSSSVTTGLVILLVQQGLLPPEAAIPVVVGANVGSTSTALVASLAMGRVARATAATNLLFNLTGLLLVFPFLDLYSRWLIDTFGAAAVAVAWAHLGFNLGIGLLFLLCLDAVEPRLRAWFALDAARP